MFQHNKILIIDDQTGIRKLLVEVLGATGYVVEEARNGTEGYRLVKELEPDLVLLDMKMPGMDGLETLRAIRQDNKVLPVILMTAYGEMEVLREAQRLGIVTNLTKPFDIMDIKKLINSTIATVYSNDSDVGKVAEMSNYYFAK